MMNEEEEVMIMAEYLYQKELKQKEIAKKWHDLAKKLIKKHQLKQDATENKINK